MDSAQEIHNTQLHMYYCSNSGPTIDVIFPMASLQIKEMAAAGDSSMMNQAQQIWSMLDDMAQNDPQAYRKFIDKQLKEGREAMKPPEPNMCIQTRIIVSTVRSVEGVNWARLLILY